MRLMLGSIIVCLIGFQAIAAPNTGLPRRNGSTTLITETIHQGDTAYIDTARSRRGVTYTDTGGITFAKGSFRPDKPMHGLLLTGGSGKVSVVLEGGGSMVLPMIIDSGTTVEFLRDYRIQILDSAKTTFTGRIFPLW